MTTSKTPTYLRRYTDLPALLHLLSSQEITLLDPKTWDDKNDSYFMSIYKEKKKLQTVLALCFSQAPETYHHWRVFSSGPAGVCIVFDRQSLLDDLNKEAGVTTGPIEYLLLTEARKRTFLVNDLPFLKRSGYKPENEYRAVYTSSSKTLQSLSIKIRLTSIRSISLSPWMHTSLSETTSSAIRSIKGCTNMRVSRSTLISNEQWKRYAAGAA
ncbi:DUF2971 domain-containing protein [Rubrivivax sp. JA1024]|nr:DUF2971 domain-containing protein [Rubrivivax sp. JA1024]